MNWMAPFHDGREWLQRDEAQRSIGMAMQTLMLVAQDMGYQTCPMIGFDSEAVAKLINLPEDHVMGPMVAAGYQRLAEPERRIMEALSVFNDQVDETAIAFLVQPWWPGLGVDEVQSSLRRLVNGHFVNCGEDRDQRTLAEGDTVSIWPPVAGG